MRASSPRIAHQARLIANKTAKVTRNPQGHYTPSQFQWGYVHSLNAGPPPSVNLYLDGTQNTANTAYLTNNVRYGAGYIPTIGDVVLVYRGSNTSSSDRVIVLKLNGSTSPYPLPLGGYNSGTSQYYQGPNAMWGGSGVPPNTLGISGDYYLRSDTPTTANQRLYVNNAGTWTGIL